MIALGWENQIHLGGTSQADGFACRGRPAAAMARWTEVIDEADADGGGGCGGDPAVSEEWGSLQQCLPMALAERAAARAAAGDVEGASASLAPVAARCDAPQKHPMHFQRSCE